MLKGILLVAAILLAFGPSRHRVAASPPAVSASDAGAAGFPTHDDKSALAAISDPGGEIAFMDLDGGIHIAPGHEAEALGICIQTVLKDRQKYAAAAAADAGPAPAQHDGGQ